MSTPGTGATTPATRKARSAGATREPPAPELSLTSAATPRTSPSSCAGDVQEVSGGRFATAITERPVPLGATIGHGQVAVSDVVRGRGERRLRRLQRPVRQRRRRRAGLPGRRRPPERPGPGDLRRSGRREVGAGATRGVPAHAERGSRRTSGVPPRHHRPGSPVRGRRPADGRARRRASVRTTASPTRRARSSTRSPGIDEADSLPRCASFDEGVHNMEVLAAVSESAAKGGASVDGRRRSGATSQRQGWRDEVRCLQRDPARPQPAGGDRGHRRARPDRHRAQLGRLPACGAHPHLRRHPDLRRGPGRLPRAVRGHRGRRRRPELQRQPAAPRTAPSARSTPRTSGAASGWRTGWASTRWSRCRGCRPANRAASGPTGS